MLRVLVVTIKHNFLEMCIAPASLLEETVSATSREVSFRQCAYCGEPLVFNTVGVVA